MKNIHVLKDKPSRLLKDIIDQTYQLKKEVSYGNRFELPLNIYITSDEEIKDGDWIFDLDTKSIVKADSFKIITSKKSKCWYYKKIILTTDQDLIKDGVQAIDDEFLEWFVKNPSCEEVETIIDWYFNDIWHNRYRIIIPKEEAKQETLEEVAENELRKQNWDTTITLPFNGGFIEGFQQGAKWQAEKMYSEEEVKQIIEATLIEYSDFVLADIPKWFEQFKKK